MKNWSVVLSASDLDPPAANRLLKHWKACYCLLYAVPCENQRKSHSATVCICTALLHSVSPGAGRQPGPLWLLEKPDKAAAAAKDFCSHCAELQPVVTVVFWLRRTCLRGFCRWRRMTEGKRKPSGFHSCYPILHLGERTDCGWNPHSR